MEKQHHINEDDLIFAVVAKIIPTSISCLTSEESRPGIGHWPSHEEFERISGYRIHAKASFGKNNIREYPGGINCTHDQQDLKPIKAASCFVSEGKLATYSFARLYVENPTYQPSPEALIEGFVSELTGEKESGSLVAQLDLHLTPMLMNELLSKFSCGYRCCFLTLMTTKKEHPRLINEISEMDVKRSEIEVYGEVNTAHPELSTLEKFNLVLNESDSDYYHFRVRPDSFWFDEDVDIRSCWPRSWPAP